jgi:hypothetical protein
MTLLSTSSLKNSKLGFKVHNVSKYLIKIFHLKRISDERGQHVGTLALPYLNFLFGQPRKALQNALKMHA